MLKKRFILIFILLFCILLYRCIAMESNNILSYFNMTKDQIINKLGNDYKLIPTGIEGADQGYQYEKIGIVIVFNGNQVQYIDCSNKVAIKGARTGMTFSQIQKKLGKTTIKETYIENESNKAYEISYKINNCLVQFLSYYKDGRDSFMTVYRI